MYLEFRKWFILLCFSSFFFSNCNDKIYVFDQSNVLFEENTPDHKLRKSKNRCCREYENYIPSDSSYEQVIRLKLHIVYDRDSVNNIALDNASKYFKTVVRLANDKLGDNQKMYLPPGNDTPVLPVKYRYEIIPDYSNKKDNGVHFIFEDSLAYYVHKGRDKNHYKREILEKYAIRPDYFLNVFFIPFPPDSLKSSSFPAHNVGIALGTSVKVAGDFIGQKRDPWKFASLLNHEIGHVLGLSHTWGGNDGCYDTPRHNNCYGEEDNDGPCGRGKASNNVMDYNHSQMAFTPCQLGKVHENFMLKNSKQRGFIRKNWCNHDEKETTIIYGREDWKQDRDLRGDLILEEDAQLKIYCRLSVPENGKIVLKKGSHLILDNAQIHNSCDKEWKGIYHYGTKAKNQSRITLIGNSDISDTQYNIYGSEVEK